MASETYSAMYLAHILKINNMIKDTSTQLSSGLTQIIIITYFAVFIKIKNITETNTVKSRAVDRSTIQRSHVSGQRSQYIRIKFPLHKESENPWACY